MYVYREHLVFRPVPNHEMGAYKINPDIKHLMRNHLTGGQYRDAYFLPSVLVRFVTVTADFQDLLVGTGADGVAVAVAAAEPPDC